MLAVLSIDKGVVEDDVDVVPPLSRVVVDPVDKFVDPGSLERIVAAPAATTHKIDTPAPTMEPVSLIFILRPPLLCPLKVLYGD
jgi:hypothetical protein